MESASVYEQKSVINELRQAIEMAKQLRVNLNSAEAREFLIQKILTSYENALFLLKSSDSAKLPPATIMPIASRSLAESPISRGSGEFGLDQPFFDQQGQNVVSKKRKGLTTWENQADITNKRTHTCNHGATPPPPPAPPSPEKYELKPTHHNQQSPPNSGEMLSNNLSVNTSAATVPSLFSFPSSPIGSMGDYQQLHFPDYFEDDILQVYSPSFISPDTSESNYFTEWGSSSLLDFSNDPSNVDLDFKFDSFLF